MQRDAIFGVPLFFGLSPVSLRITGSVRTGEALGLRLSSGALDFMWESQCLGRERFQPAAGRLSESGRGLPHSKTLRAAGVG